MLGREYSVWLLQDVTFNLQYITPLFYFLVDSEYFRFLDTKTCLRRAVCVEGVLFQFRPQASGVKHD
jgi:hypothetical protein